MSYITEMFERADIQQIRDFLLNGTELPKRTHAPYEQRLAKSMNEVMEMIQAHFPNEQEQMENSIIQAVSAYEDVYLEIGLQIGIKLAMQVLNFRM